MKYKYENLIVAYGSNLCSRDFEAYAQRHGETGSCLQFEEVIVIPDYKLAFNVSSKTRCGGVLNLESAKGFVTYGVLFSANDVGLNLVRRKEGVPYKYEEVKIAALRRDGSEVEAMTYIVPTTKTENFVEPSASYLSICMEGYKEYCLDTFDLQDAAENKVLEPAPALFCYGTLMRGESRFHIIKNHGVSCAIMALSFGSLSTDGRYPAPHTQSNGVVFGDYFVSENIGFLLDETDAIEGFYGFGNKNNLFRRTYIEVDVGGLGQRGAWVYVMDTILSVQILEKGWREHNDRHLDFLSDVIDAHAKGTPDFDMQVRSNVYRYAPNPPSQFSKSEMTDMLSGFTLLTERHLAQVSGLWTVLT